MGTDKVTRTGVQTIIDAQIVHAVLVSTMSFTSPIIDYDRDTVATTKSITLDLTGAKPGSFARWEVTGGVTTIHGAVNSDTIITSTGTTTQVVVDYNNGRPWVYQQAK